MTPIEDGANTVSGRDRTLFEYAPDGILIADPQSRYLDANPSICRMLGYERHELIGRHARDIVEASEVENVDPALELIRERRDYLREWLFKRKDGSIFPAEVMVTTMPDGNLLALIRDATERLERERAHEDRRKAEEAAHNERLFSKAVLDSLPGILYLYDERRRFRRWNRNFEVVSGYSGADIEQMEPLDFFPPQAKGRVGQKIQEVFERGEAFVEAPFLTRDGRQVPYLFTGLRVTFDGVPCLIGMGVDISKWKAVETALGESEAEFRTLTEAMPQLVWMSQPDGAVSYLSQQWMDYTGLNMEEMLKRGLEAVLHPEDREEALSAWRRATAELSPHTIECRLRRADGVYGWWLIRAVPLRDAGGVVRKWVGTCTDIQDLKRAGLEITRMNRALTMLSGCNEAVVRAGDEEGLLQAVCRIAVEVGGYRMGRVYGPSNDPAILALRAHAGERPDSINALPLPWQPDRPEGPGPITRVLRSGQSLVIPDLLEEPSLRQVIREMEEARIRGGIYLPLKGEQEVFGVLALYDAHPLRVQEDEVLLLHALADNLAFGIGVLRARAEKERTTLALRATLREKEVLLKEVHHRVNNNMQVIISLLRLEGSRAAHQSTREVLTGMQNRLQSMALLHEGLYRSPDLAQIDLGTYVADITRQLVRSHAAAGQVQIRTDLISVELDMDHAIPCGLLVNELVSNSLKHAFADGRPGVVQVELHRIDQGDLRLRISDDGVGLPEDFEVRRAGGLGLRLVSDLTRQLRGRLEIGPHSAFTVVFSPNSQGAGSRLRGVDSGPMARGPMRT